MKSYEEMARNVLRRRDMELKHKRAGKRHSAFRGSETRSFKGANTHFSFGVPYAAAGLAAAVVIGTVIAVKSQIIVDSGNTSLHPQVCVSHANEVVSAAEPMPSTSHPWEYSNPFVGQTRIVWLSAEKPSTSEPEFDEKDFTEYTLEGLDGFYRLRFNRLGEVYADWQLSYDKLGICRREFEENGAMVLERLYTRNTLNYTTESGAKVTVSAQRGKFEPISGETFTADKPITRPNPQATTEYDKDGNIIAQNTEGFTGYAPDPAVSVDPAPDPAVSCPPGQTITPAEGVSTVNGYEALIYRLSDGSFLADLDMNSRVRITAEGLSDEKFLEILDNFTK